MNKKLFKVFIFVFFSWFIVTGSFLSSAFAHEVFHVFQSDVMPSGFMVGFKINEFGNYEFGRVAGAEVWMDRVIAERQALVFQGFVGSVLFFSGMFSLYQIMRSV